MFNNFQKIVEKWTPIIAQFGASEDRYEWMSEMAHYQSEAAGINESRAYANAGIAGMGNVISPQPSTFPGTLNGANYGLGGGSNGSGDIGANMIPVSMKIAAQTIGLDLVAVKPTASPKIDLLYVDYVYDDVRENGEDKPMVFKINGDNIATVISDIKTQLDTAGIRTNVGGLSGSQNVYFILTGTFAATFTTTEPVNKQNVLQFLGFSRIDGLPMFRSYRQPNSSSLAMYTYDVTKNTFAEGTTVLAAIQASTLFASLTDNTIIIEQVSALEDHIPGFVTNWENNGSHPMARQTEEDTYAGNIGPKVHSRTVQVGGIQVSSALRRTEIEDIKASMGIDIVQKMETVLVNELSQLISKNIVNKIFELGEVNRASAPASANNPALTRFDLDTSYVAGIGGETTHAVQRKLITKLVYASNYIAVEGRVGPAQFAVTNAGLGAVLMDIAGYSINPVKSKINAGGQMYPIGVIGDITIYVDPYMSFDDNRIVIGRKNKVDEPGLVFVPYLMAQSIQLTSEATWAPRLLLRSRFAITDLGFYPHKQYMTIHVIDDEQLLN